MSAQKLLVPETIELGYREAGVLEKLIPELSGTGLDVEPFGGNTFVVKAVPSLLTGREIKPILIEIVEKIAEIGAAPGFAEALEEIQGKVFRVTQVLAAANARLDAIERKGQS